MGAFFIYILKSAVCLVLFYLFFKLLLSRETFHRFNRVALLGVLLLSLLIPCIEVTTRHQVEVQQAVLSIEQLLMMAEMENAVPAEVETGEWQQAPDSVSLSWIQIVLLVYLTGIVVLVCRNVYSLLCLIRLICSGRREKQERGITLVVHDRAVAPFSWMKYIVISRKDLEENGREILIHETAHIRNRHSIDLLIADVCIFFQWFNPGAWLLKQELQNIHEYEADETVINEGVNAKEYQLLLIKKAVGTRLYSMANSFNHSKLKKRITMMLKEKSNPWARLKYLYVLPLAAIAVTAFARPEISEKADEISAVKVNDLAAILEARNEENVVEASVVDTAKNKVVVVGKVMSKDSVFIVKGEKATSISVSGASLSNEKTPLIIINGKESDRAVVDALDPSRIENISVLKNENAVKIYGEKAKDGAMIIQLKSTEVQMFSNKDAIGANVKMRLDALNSGDKNWGVKFHSATGGQPLVFIDGEEALGDDPLSNISPDRIRSLSVMKGKQAMAVYGNRGKDGVILVNLKAERKYPNKENLPNPTKINTESELPKKENTFVIGGPHDAEWHADQTKRMNAALIIIDGKEVKSDAISTLSPERIKNFTVLKDKAAIDAYGEKGKNGVVLITLLTEGEYEFQKNGSKKPYADALELAESVAKGVEGEVIYCIDDDEIRKTKLKGMSAKEIKAVSVDDFGKKKVVRLKTDKYRSDWITVTGEVYGEDGKPTVAIVNVKGTGFMERTDANGHFTIKAPKKGELLIGYNDKPTIEVKVKSALKVVLKGK